jgi:hypothetical protein
VVGHVLMGVAGFFGTVTSGLSMFPSPMHHFSITSSVFIPGSIAEYHQGNTLGTATEGVGQGVRGTTNTLGNTVSELGKGVGDTVGGLSKGVGDTTKGCHSVSSLILLSF